MNRKQKIGIGCAAVILAAMWFIAPPEGLSAEGMKTLGLLLAALILWITEAVPIAVTALALVAFQPIYGIAAPGAAFTNFINSVFFFVIASYGISIAIMNTTFINRMANSLLRRTGGGAFKVILALTSAAALLSAFISNVPACAVLMGFAIGMLEPLEDGPSKTGLRKTLMIAIPFGAMIGGIATPAGSSVNILALDLLEASTGMSISFLEWMLYGVPITLVAIPFTVLVLMKLFKPKAMGEESVAIIIEQTKVDQPLTAKEKKLIMILILMMTFWIAGTWVPVFNITIVALVGLIFMFLPGVEILNWDNFMKEVSWDAVIMIGGVSSIGTAVTATGVSNWFMGEAASNLLDMGMVPLIALIGMFLNIIHLILPIAPAIVAVGVQPLVDLAEAMSISPVTFIVTLSFMAGICLLLPLDAVPLITYTKKYYTMWDMFKAGIIVSTAIVVMLAFWGTFAGSLLGY
ncbi:MAG: SLC13 family permease [Eubacteriales bacterium]|nr:SLC13 family permease [Eubacteriales bacterium]MDD4582828.1 SLC13 family permease [Eubacteriales bacterium]